MRRLTWLFGLSSAIVPTAVAWLLARGDGLGASCDEAVLRTLGRGYTGLFHGLDGLVTLPFGAHPQWASMGCAGLLGVVVFTVVRPWLRGDALADVLAFFAAILATIPLPVVRESTLAFGSTLGAVLALLPLATRLPVGVRVAAVGLSFACDVPTGVAAALALSAKLPRPRELAWALFGLVPVMWMAVRHRVAPDASLDVGALAGWLGDGAEHVPASQGLRIVHRELGVFAIGLAAVGVMAAWGRSRRWTLAATSVLAVGLAAPLVGAPAGPSRYGSMILGALAVVAMFTVVGLGRVVEAVAKAPIPMARTSASLIVVLCLALPARIADDTALALASAPPDPTAAWNERVLGGLPRDSVVLLPTPELVRRAKAARAVGALAPSILLVPLHGTSGIGRAIASEPLLAPVLRDLVLYGAPEELSLSELATTRPVLVAFDARWSRAIAKHLVPEGLFDRYFVEPRGTVERTRMLAAATLDEPTMTAIRKSPPLADATLDLLRARMLASRALGERDYAQSATAEVQRIAPEIAMDPEPTRQARRELTASVAR